MCVFKKNILRVLLYGFESSPPIATVYLKLAIQVIWCVLLQSAYIFFNPKAFWYFNIINHRLNIIDPDTIKKLKGCSRLKNTYLSHKHSLSVPAVWYPCHCNKSTGLQLVPVAVYLYFCDGHTAVFHQGGFILRWECWCDSVVFGEWQCLTAAG